MSTKPNLYDGEGRLCAVQNTIAGITTMVQYIYDAEGNRVAKGTSTSWLCLAKIPSASVFIYYRWYRGDDIRAGFPPSRACYNSFMLRILSLCCGLITGSLRSRKDLLLENLALRQQLAVLGTRHPRPRYTAPDKLFWVMLRRLWPQWKSTLFLVQPETVVGRHRAGFKLYWKWISRKRSGRRPVSK